MPSMDFVDGVTVIPSSWLNDVDAIVFGQTGNFNVVTMNPTTPESTPEGTFWYDDATRLFQLATEVPGTSLSVGFENFIQVYNGTGSTIYNGQPVYHTGVSNGHPSVAPASALSDATAGVLGVAIHNIPTGEVGYITSFGVLHDVDTSAFSAGATLYLSETAGELTTTPPAPASVVVIVGIVLTVDDLTGSLIVYTGNNAGISGTFLLANQSELEIVTDGVAEPTRLLASASSGTVTLSTRFGGGDPILNVDSYYVNLDTNSEEGATVKGQVIATRTWTDSEYVAPIATAKAIADAAQSTANSALTLAGTALQGNQTTLELLDDNQVEATRLTVSVVSPGRVAMSTSHLGGDPTYTIDAAYIDLQPTAETDLTVNGKVVATREYVDGQVNPIAADVIEVTATANQALADAATAQTTADSAYSLASTALQSNQSSIELADDEFPEATRVTLAVGSGIATLAATFSGGDSTLNINAADTINLNTTGNTVKISSDGLTAVDLNVTGYAEIEELVSVALSTSTFTASAPSVITVNSSDPALRITQQGAGSNALVVEDSASPDSTPFIVDYAGRIVCGHTSAMYDQEGSYARSQVHGIATADSRIGVFNWNSGSSTPKITLNKSYSGTLGTLGGNLPTGTYLGELRFNAGTTSGWNQGAAIAAVSAEAHTDSSTPTYVTISTTPSGGSSFVERMRIRANGGIGLGTSGTDAISLFSSKNVTGASVSYGIIQQGAIQPDVTSARGFQSSDTVAAETALTTLYRYHATQGTVSGSIGNQYGYYASSGLVGATNNYGFFGDIPFGTGRWNLFMAGTAANYLAGSLKINNTTDCIHAGFSGVTVPKVQVTGNGGEASLALNSFQSGVNVHARLLFGRSDSNTPGDYSDPVDAGDALGEIHFSGSNGTAFGEGCTIKAIAEETFSGTAQGTYLTINTMGLGSTVKTERVRVTANGQLLVKSAAGLGYGTGAGGSVTQLTDKSTAVTIHKPTGRITTASTSMPINGTAAFTVNNSTVTEYDVVHVQIVSGGSFAAYNVYAGTITNGAFSIVIRNVSGGSLAEALTLNFVVLKGAIT